MKKFTALLIALVLMMNMVAIMASADATKPTDITADIKWVTAYDMYANKLPVVRADAIFMYADEYDTSLVGKLPGSGLRMITFTDWESAGLTNYFNDVFYVENGTFAYNAVWANNSQDGDASAPYDHGRLSYTFEVPEDGTYELVIVGCGQIKAENVDNDSKDRGFTYQIDGGELFQVNISDTPGAFVAYEYDYDKATLESTAITTTNGVNSYKYQMVYYYGMQMYLTAGTHTLDYYHLFYSGEHVFESGNGPRLNYAGAFVQKYLSGTEWENYVYPETTVPETTVAPETTEAPEVDETTKAPDADETTAAPEGGDATQAPTTNAPTTDKAEEKGCGAMMGFAAIIALVPAAVVLKTKRN